MESGCFWPARLDGSIFTLVDSPALPNRGQSAPDPRLHLNYIIFAMMQQLFIIVIFNLAANTHQQDGRML